MSEAYEWGDLLPSRAKKPIPRSSHGHFVVQMVINDANGVQGRISSCGSIAEYRTRMIALAESDTLDVVEQVGPIPWVDEGNVTREHFLDHVVHKADGRRLGLTDKPYGRVTREFGEEIRQVSRNGRESGQIDDLFLVTEYGHDPVALYNAELMRGCRDEDIDADRDARAVVSEMTGKANLGELVGLIDLSPVSSSSLR